MLGDDGFLELVRFFWIIILPCFAMIFFVRCVDIFACRKFQAKNSRWKIFMLDLCTVAFFQLSVGIIEALLIFKKPAFVLLPFLIVPIFSIIVLMITYYSDRNRTKDMVAESAFAKETFKSNLIIALSYEILYGVFFHHYYIMEMDWGKPAFTESDGILLVATLVLLVICTVYKIFNSKRLIKDVIHGSENK